MTINNMEKVLDGEVVSSNETPKETVTEWETKIKEFTGKIESLIKEYSDWCSLQAVNAVNQAGEVHPAIKVIRLK